MPPTGDLASSPGMCPHWESNQRPCGLQASAQSTEPHQPGLSPLFLSHLPGAYSFAVSSSFSLYLLISHYLSLIYLYYYSSLLFSFSVSDTLFTHFRLHTHWCPEILWFNKAIGSGTKVHGFESWFCHLPVL